MPRIAFAATLLTLWLGATLALCGAIVWTSYAVFVFAAATHPTPIAALAAALTLVLVAATVAWAALLSARPSTPVVADRTTINNVIPQWDTPHAATLALVAGFAVGACPRLRSTILRALF